MRRGASGTDARFATTHRSRPRQRLGAAGLPYRTPRCSRCSPFFVRWVVRLHVEPVAPADEVVPEVDGAAAAAAALPHVDAGHVLLAVAGEGQVEAVETGPVGSPLQASLA